MKFKIETALQKFNRQKEWHKWFAWHPIWLNNGEFYWLCFINRRSRTDFEFAGIPLNPHYEYEEIK